MKICDGSCQSKSTSVGIAVVQVVDREVRERVQNAVRFAKARKYLAVPIDMADMTAILAAIGAEP